MRHAIAWSYDLLTEEEQHLFRWLTVFRAGSTIEAVEAVAAVSGVGNDILDSVAALADSSLLHTQDGEMPHDAPEARFGLLETIREFGWELLESTGDVTAAREAHAAYFLSLAERIEPPDEPDTWYGENTAGSLRLEADHDNFRAALSWFAETDRSEEGLRLAGALGNMWFCRGYSPEGVGWLERFLTRGGKTARVRQKALLRLTGLAVVHGDDVRTRQFGTEALALAREVGDRAGAGDALLLLAGPYQFTGEYAQAESLHEEALALFREVGDIDRIATQLTNLAIGAYGLGDAARAVTLAEEAMPLWRGIGNDWGLGYNLRVLGDVACDRGRQRGGRVLCRESDHRRTQCGSVGDSGQLDWLRVPRSLLEAL